jgi:hypothetical protein
MPSNEETLRTHVLLPFLRTLGFSPQDIQVERTFRLRLGRTVHEPRSNEVTGRADLLVRSPDGKNLFIVELKRPDSILTNDDRDQGISYARLLDQIAPFVLLSNGKQSKLFDSITREELDSENFTSKSTFFASGGSLATAEDIRIRWEALEHFIGYSQQNVQAFSQAQVASRIRPLRGVSGQEGKYVRDLYVPRAQAREALDNFLAGSGSVFAIVGESGFGKTNEMCALAETLAETHVVLFLAAYAITSTPGEMLLDEFNWGFSQQLLQPELLRRLGRLAASIGRPVIIFLDGLDEAIVPNFPIAVSEFATRIHATSGSVRLIVSVKTTEWSNFSTIRGNPSGLRLALDATWRTNKEGTNAIAPDPHPFVLGEFSEQEFLEAASKYRDQFHLPSVPMRQLKAVCKEPFFLRVVSETYAGRSNALPDDSSRSEIYRNWLDRKFANMGNPERARNDLVRVAAGIYNRAKTGKKENELLIVLETVAESEFAAPLTPELITHGVITQSRDEHGRASLRLHHGRILYYLIARHVLQLDKLTSAEFGSFVPTLLSNYVLQSVLAWHLREAPHDHMMELSKELRGRATIFVTEYSRILGQKAPGLRGQVEPFTTGDIGIAYHIDEFGLGAFGLYPIGGAFLNRVVELQADPNNERDEFEALWAFGCRGAQARGINFSNSDPAMAAADFALEQIKKALNAGALDESASKVLIQESVLAICSEYGAKLGLPKSQHWLLRKESIVPLNLKEVSRKLQYYFGKQHYLQLWTDAQIHSDSEFVEHPNGMSSVTIHISSEAIAEADARALKEAQGGAIFPSKSYVQEADLAHLPSLLDALLKSGVDIIETTELPTPDVKPIFHGASFSEMYTDARIAELMSRFFSAGLAAYKTLVESNFSGLANLLPVYACLPCTVVASYQRPKLGYQYQPWGHVHWGICPIDKFAEVPPVVHLNPQQPIFRWTRDDSKEVCVSVDGLTAAFGYTASDLGSLLRPHHIVGFGLNCPRANSAHDAPVRAFAYNLLIREFNSIENRHLI